MHAYYGARKGKRTTFDEYKFETGLGTNILSLVESIENRTYVPSRSVAFVISVPVVREIFAAPFRDRVVHHIIIDAVMPWWDRRFIEDSYSCRKNKGTLYGIERLQLKIHQAYTDPEFAGERVFVLKFDIKGYFMSMKREYLLKLALNGLKKQFPTPHDPRYELFAFLWAQTILDDPTVGVTLRGGLKAWKKVVYEKSLLWQPYGQGIVIGNVTSQLLSNIMLDELDRFVEYELGYTNRYGRYVDDFFLVVHESEMKQALEDKEKISKFLLERGLTLHPKKFHIYDARKGVPFIGARVSERHITGGGRVIGNFRRTLWDIREYGLTPKLEARLICQIGHLKKFNCFNFMVNNLHRAGLLDRFAEYLRDGDEKPGLIRGDEPGHITRG